MSEKEKAVAIPSTADDPATTSTQSVADVRTKGNKRQPKDDRMRNFATVIYPESAVDGWMEKLQSFHVEAVVSPLHDRDVNPTGEKKKPHYHVLVMFQGKKTKEQAKSLFDAIGGVGLEVVNSTRGMARYLCHLDNPEKEQYDVGKVIEFGGADYQTLISLPSDKYGTLKEILDFIERNDVVSFSELLRWCGNNNEKWFRALSDNCAYIVKEYLSSRYYAIKEGLFDKSAEWTLEGKYGHAPDSGNPGAAARSEEEDPQR